MKKLFIIHGWSYNIDRWALAMEELKQRDIEPIMLKVPGLTTESNKVWDIDEYTDWLYKQLKDEKQPISLLGHSNGGRIALNFVQKYPDIIKKLILVDSAGIYRKDIKIQLKRAVFGTASKIGKKFTKSLKIRKLLYKLARETDYEKAPENMRQTMANMIASDQKLDVSKVSVPTEIIWGSNDTVTPPTDAASLNNDIQGSHLQFIDGARHSPFDTHPSEFADLVKGIMK